MALQIRNLHVSVGGKLILRGVNLQVKPGEVHAIMGPNGSGKSTLGLTLLGHPAYTIERGLITLDGKRINRLSPEERARRGLFLGFQYPLEIAGVGIRTFLRSAYNATHPAPLSVVKFRNYLEEKAHSLHIPEHFLARGLNEGFSGGEKKRAELLQMTVLKPRYAILDETDSGLDIDALKAVASGIEAYRSSERGIALITHYQRILNFVKPDCVHVMVEGKIVASGDRLLAKALEKKGYRWLSGKPAVGKEKSEVGMGKQAGQNANG